MQGRLVSYIGVCITALPAFVFAQQAGVVPPVPAATSASPAPAVSAAPAATPAAEAEITVNIGGQAPKSGGLAPLAKAEFDLPAGLIPPSVTAIPGPSPLIPRPVPAPPAAKLTPIQIAQQIAPNFNVTRDYVRLTQCYGIADFMGAVTRIQASRPGATPQVVRVAQSIAALQDGMQPMVLAASTVRTEARFRADYDAIARRGQNELATSRAPNVTMQRRLASLDACRADVVRWRGGR